MKIWKWLGFSAVYRSPRQARKKKKKRGYVTASETSLYRLGVALLQIGLWKPLDATKVAQVRQAEERPSQFGPKYDLLTQRCLNFDFDGSRPDLNDKGLQTKVYKTVVMELERMVDALDGPTYVQC